MNAQIRAALATLCTLAAIGAFIAALATWGEIVLYVPLGVVVTIAVVGTIYDVFLRFFRGRE